MKNKNRILAGYFKIIWFLLQLQGLSVQTKFNEHRQTFCKKYTNPITSKQHKFELNFLLYTIITWTIHFNKKAIWDAILSPYWNRATRVGWVANHLSPSIYFYKCPRVCFKHPRDLDPNIFVYFFWKIKYVASFTCFFLWRWNNKKSRSKNL